MDGEHPPRPPSPGKLHPNWQPEVTPMQLRPRPRQNSHRLRAPGSRTPRMITTNTTSTSSTTSFAHRTMPSLTNDTSQFPKDNAPPTILTSRSTSPIRPPYSPITPTLSTARIATSNPSSSNNGPQARYTHTQPPQTSIPQPKPIPIVPFDENPDVLALKSAASILQIQARNAVKDIQALQRIKERALQDPVAFAKALESGAIKTRADLLYNPGQDDDDDDEVEGNGKVKVKGKGGKDKKEGKEEKWEPLPASQNVVRCPPINWNQYAVVGDSLDKIHKDQVERPSEGVPQKLGKDGSLVAGGEGARRREDLGIAAPYQPGKDKIEKIGTKKGGKR